MNSFTDERRSGAKFAERFPASLMIKPYDASQALATTPVNHARKDAKRQNVAVVEKQTKGRQIETLSRGTPRISLDFGDLGDLEGDAEQE